MRDSRYAPSKNAGMPKTNSVPSARCSVADAALGVLVTSESTIPASTVSKNTTPKYFSPLLTIAFPLLGVVKATVKRMIVTGIAAKTRKTVRMNM